MIAYVIFKNGPEKWTGNRDVDFRHFLDWKELGVFGVAAVIVVVGAWLVDKSKAASMIKSVREETSTAIINLCSILTVVSISEFNFLYLGFAVAGYVRAGRLP